MVVYGYKPDTFIAVYPALQGTDTPRCNIFKNTTVYPADWLAENYRHYLKVRFVLQQLQMVQRAELVNFAPPRPHIWCGWSKRTFTSMVCSFSSVSLITPVTIKPVKIHSQRLPISSLFTSVVFIFLKFTYYSVIFFAIHSSRLRRHSASVLATVLKSSPSVWR